MGLQLQTDLMRCDVTAATDTSWTYAIINESMKELFNSPAGWCTSRETSSSAQTSTSSISYPGSLCSLSSCTASPGDLADPALSQRSVSCSCLYHCLRTENTHIHWDLLFPRPQRKINATAKRKYSIRGSKGLHGLKSKNTRNVSLWEWNWVTILSTTRTLKITWKSQYRSEVLHPAYLFQLWISQK